MPPSCLNGVSLYSSMSSGNEFPHSVSVRKATTADLESMLTIALSAMPLDPQWDYRLQHRHKYPEDTKAFTRLKYEEFLTSPARWRVMVAELSGDSRRSIRRPIAFAVWDVSNFRLGYPRDAIRRLITMSPQGRRRDANEERMTAWREAMTSSKHRLFDEPYGDSHFHLQVLATHPQYQRLGAGAALCKHGIAQAQAEGKRISVFASPMGRRLYRRLGFREVGAVMVQAPNDDEFVQVAALIYEPQKAPFAFRTETPAKVPLFYAQMCVSVIEVPS